MTFITVFAGPIGLEKVGWKFWLWVVSGNLVAIVFVFFLCPETGGKTLEQVDFLFSHSAFVNKMQETADEEWTGDGEAKTADEQVEIKE